MLGQLNSGFARNRRLNMHLTFLGAAREVTGSCYLVELDDCRFLIDCGMLQGGRDAVIRNHQPFAFDPRTIDFVLLTHAHIDHSGLLPKLTRQGFTGPILRDPSRIEKADVLLIESTYGDRNRPSRLGAHKN